MLESIDAIATIAVKDLVRARDFYENVLGLHVIGTEGEHVVTFASGKTRINVYESQLAGTNAATALSWSVGDHLDALVRLLKGRGVTFEHYNVPGMMREGDVYVSGHIRNAWFKDPDGNILSIFSA